MCRMIALSVVLVCLAVFADSHQIRKNSQPGIVNKNLEEKFNAKYGNGKLVKWEELSKMTEEQRASVCKSVHEKTGFGKLEDGDLKETSTQDAYLKFSNAKFRKVFTQILGCKKNNKEQYVYYLAKALDKDSVMLVNPAKNSRSKGETFNGQNVFTFTRRDQITSIPVLQKL